MTAFKPQLANRIKQNKLPKYAEDGLYWWERKLDGVREVLVVEDGNVRSWGRSGSEMAVSRDIHALLSHLNGRWVFDCERVSGVSWCFDVMVQAGTVDVNEKSPYWKRREALDLIAPTLTQKLETFRVLPTCKTKQEKLALFAECKTNHYEGVMVKDSNGLYFPGRRSDSVLKAKFVETIDVVVDEVNRLGKKSIGISLYENGELVSVGACTVLNDKKRNALNVGDVVEIEYLYAVDGSRKLVQPAFLKKRDDKAATDCDFDQMKFTDKTVA